MPARKGMANEHTQINLFLPVLQGERSESAKKQQPEKEHQGFPAGKCLCACSCMLMLSLSGFFLFSGEGECTRPIHDSKNFFSTQPDNDMIAAINTCISVGKWQGRSDGAQRAHRAREIRAAMAAPSQVRASMISNVILRIKCQAKMGLINPKLLTRMRILYSTAIPSVKAFFEMDLMTRCTAMAIATPMPQTLLTQTQTSNLKPQIRRQKFNEIAGFAAMMSMTATAILAVRRTQTTSRG